jgi:hypothetical protein
MGAGASLQQLTADRELAVYRVSDVDEPTPPLYDPIIPRPMPRLPMGNTGAG